ncbi:cell division protein FtsB [Caldimonas thermodepolymerans]|jgi:Septum formation initiator|uniref:Cell division protein FtsB n=1 Tax=Caldimonas thermodepolymerans TaxID=215580 RepID=A0A2S5T2L8_9BURK|nr:cell division protein FtsB [Caldimonas thermodepolymerans]PPE69220.1 cell division protein FtsB [Caldimonas thermodepolymerans]QPC32874.1 cell division protein FtsB [Caldimonas thermodepolymerans]RDI03651.1 cell division protein FtsB [Caldimonas thermodepolymerans]TCP09620.1 cell division protein FtsB [Caldimonas thermodepolymerans]UZG45743.1 cell division protein FtsB [Caldimonas thermodepolymerans]
MSARLLTLVLAGLLVLVHAELWFGKHGVHRVMELQGRLAEQRAKNDRSRERNQQLAAEVSDLREGLEMVEEKARYDLGMIKPDEIYVQLTPPPR